ncbi:MAG: AAA family ATPase [Calothrix sp. SM1_7_51]|nr:AAA family ATPase [Calothrix sp. SM1_7_51]
MRVGCNRGVFWYWETALVQELYKPLTPRKGHFISGKYDQYKRDIPHTCLAEAYRGLMRQILSEDKEIIADWRKRFLSALGSNAQVMIDIIPELELIIGKQPPVAKLETIESQNRFFKIFSRFVLAIQSPEYPLVMFMDDLQWADSTSIHGLTEYILNPDAGYSLSIIAYRDNEVDAIIH